jgi:hypothetical protein
LSISVTMRVAEDSDYSHILNGPEDVLRQSLGAYVGKGFPAWADVMNLAHSESTNTDQLVQFLAKRLALQSSAGATLMMASPLYIATRNAYMLSLRVLGRILTTTLKWAATGPLHPVLCGEAKWVADL